MAVQHRDITDSQLHEPKGIVSAVSGTMYIAGDVGTGTWRKAGLSSIKGIANTAGGLRAISDGADGFVLKTDAAYGSMVMLDNHTGFTTTAAADASLKTNSQYQILTGTGAPWVAENLSTGVTFNLDRLTVAASGVYRVDYCGLIRSFPATTVRVATKYRINGTTYPVRNQQVRSDSVGDEQQVIGFAMVTMYAGDYIQLCMATTAAGSIIYNDFDFTINLVRAI